MKFSSFVSVCLQQQQQKTTFLKNSRQVGKFSVFLHKKKEKKSIFKLENKNDEMEN